MTAIRYITPASILMVVLYTACGAATNEGWLVYTGAWFKIDFPSTFSVASETKSSTSATGHDGVTFRSMDGTEFYVYSPQSSGREADYRDKIAAEPSRERIGRQKSLVRDYVVNGKVVQTNAIQIKAITIVAKDSSYTRSYEITENRIESSMLIFGFRCADKIAWANHKAAYDRFRRSLVRYAD